MAPPSGYPTDAIRGTAERSVPVVGGVQLPRENVYGHLKRLHWIRDRLRPTDRAIEFGCGTGFMLTLPLRVWGYDVRGVDLDERSIAGGREIMAAAGQPRDALQAIDLRDLDGSLDAVIASEVLEHLEDTTLAGALAAIHERLRHDGALLVTVPNGYGWFELEALLWNRTPLGRLFRLGVVRGLAYRLRRRLAGAYVDAAHPSTLADSPHVRRFTLRSLCETLESAGFAVELTRGSVMFCGPFTHALLTGVAPFMRWNARLGDRFPTLAAGFYVAARRVPRGSASHQLISTSTESTPRSRNVAGRP
jgi:SAM-dependent methyltransferase